MPVRQVMSFLVEGLRDALSPRRKALRELRARWGKPADSDAWYASRYFDLVRPAADAPGTVDDKTWTDLEFPELFAAMNATVSQVGGQVLFHQMRTRCTDAGALAAKYALYRRLQADVPLRETLQRKLLSLAAERHARIVDFLFGGLPPPLRPRWLLHAWSLASLGVLLASLAWPGLGALWFAIVVVNVFVLMRVGISGRILRDLQTLRACLQLVKVANDLGALHARYPDVPALAQLHAERAQRLRLSRVLAGFVMWDAWASLFPISMLVMVLNAAFLVNLNLYARAMQRFAGLRGALAPSFELVGVVDAALAVASWLQYCPQHCRPALTDARVLDIRDGRHPLLGEDAVLNSIRLDGRSVLVTGSNMAGKTTFIKMVALNALLGQTLGFCLANAATLPRCPVAASIHNEHSVASGKSHYFAEVETIRGFLAAQAAGQPLILAIDELFSGTNTVERIAIARAVLEVLGEGSIVLATTHDVELQALLGRHYDLYHFQEDPAVDGYFDYRLRPGAATARNAIRLLAEQKYPAAVIEHALVYAKTEANGAGADARATQPLNLALPFK